MLNFFVNPGSNMFEICLSKNIQKSKFHDLTHVLGRELAEGIKMKKILKFVPSRLLKLLT